VKTAVTSDHALVEFGRERCRGAAVAGESCRSVRTEPRDSSGPSLVWRVHPARDRVGAACFAAAVVTAMAWLSAAMMQSVWWGALAVVVLFVALRRFFLPSQFRIDAEGITARNSLSRQRYHWSQIFRFSCDRRGGYLSTRSRSSVLDIFRGMHLLFGEDRETVVAQIRERLNSEAGR